MRLFAVFGTDPGYDQREELKRRLELHFKDNYLKVGAYQWIIATNDTTKGVGEKLLDEENKTSFIVSGMNGYWGYHSGDTWEWLSVKAKDDG